MLHYVFCETFVVFRYIVVNKHHFKFHYTILNLKFKLFRKNEQNPVNHIYFIMHSEKNRRILTYGL